MAKPNYQFQKRQKELQKKKKMEEQRRKKLEESYASRFALALTPSAYSAQFVHTLLPRQTF